MARGAASRYVPGIRTAAWHATGILFEMKFIAPHAFVPRIGFGVRIEIQP